MWTSLASTLWFPMAGMSDWAAAGVAEDACETLPPRPWPLSLASVTKAASSSMLGCWARSSAPRAALGISSTHLLTMSGCDEEVSRVTTPTKQLPSMSRKCLMTMPGTSWGLIPNWAVKASWSGLDWRQLQCLLLQLWCSSWQLQMLGVATAVLKVAAAMPTTTSAMHTVAAASHYLAQVCMSGACDMML